MLKRIIMRLINTKEAKEIPISDDEITSNQKSTCTEGNDIRNKAQWTVANELLI